MDNERDSQHACLGPCSDELDNWKSTVQCKTKCHVLGIPSYNYRSGAHGVEVGELDMRYEGKKKIFIRCYLAIQPSCCPLFIVQAYRKEEKASQPPMDGSYQVYRNNK